AAVFSLARMTKNNELIAVINSGMSIYRMTASMAIFGLVFSVFLVWFNDEVVFPAERRANTISDKIRHGENPNNKSVSDVRLWGQSGVFWKAKYYDDRKMELRDVLLLKLRQRIGEKLPAEMALNELVNRAVPVKSVTVRSNAEGGADLVVRSVPDINAVRYLDDVRLLTPARYWLYRVEAASARYNKKRQGWDFQKGRIRYYDGPAERVIPFESRFFPLGEIPFDFERADTRVNGMTTGEARAHISKLEKLGAAHRKELVEYYLKFSFPLVNGIIIIIGISFGGFSPRSVLVLSFFIAVLIYLLYYTFVALGLSLGKTGVLDPALGAWLGNIGFFLIGAGLLVFRKT
ncbi:MAG TPA: LptF/LptG family permease, partial [Spirochaetota bacterium]|nr:LptF/LptG family permease [Spirochaetota bacterium]